MRPAKDAHKALKCFLPPIFWREGMNDHPSETGIEAFSLDEG